MGGHDRRILERGEIPERTETVEDLERHWDLIVPYLWQRVSRVLANFGDVDDLVDEILDNVRARCVRQLRRRSINRRFICKTATRVALTKRDLLLKHQEVVARRLRQHSSLSAESLPGWMEILRRIDQALLAVDGKEKRIIFEILSQLRKRETIAYKEIGEALGCSGWKARVMTARCFEKIREYLVSRPTGDADRWFG